MPEIGAGTDVRIDAINEAAIKIGQIVKAEIMAGTSAEIQAEIDEMVEQGIFKRDDCPTLCSGCKSPIPDDEDTCPYCGSYQEEASVTENSFDTEMVEDETPVHAVEPEDYEELSTSRDLAERFEEIFLELGFDSQTAQKCAQFAARMWEEVKPQEENAYLKCVENASKAFKARLLEDKVKERLLDEFDALASEEEKNAETLPFDVEIYKDENEKWAVRVENQLLDLELAKPGGRIVLSKNFSVTAKKYLEIIKNRNEKIAAVCCLLKEHHVKFLNAGTIEQAEEILRETPLIQAKVANEAKVHESTLSRWCKGVFIQTEHGRFPMSAFFHRAAEPTGSSKSTDALRDKIKLAQQAANKAEKLEEKNKVKEIQSLLSKEGISIKPAYLRKLIRELNEQKTSDGGKED